ncbi:uncharacterized protein N7511_002531 [Penicillium nucicola]|uniref:uncharacterized protein n=1 Tax=Penicillium nucicola TaxID=1850975 RepID=UPI00254572AB|nr:uncharacterized protein N7511_002531 [Penicillium nucicola]KAJ5770480.1 hypothetical protein N7511_002531 [Penicillium nucicola]
MFKQLWWATTMQSPQILVAASYAARSGDLRIKANRVILCGLAETGDVTRRFILHESRLQLPDGTIPFEGFLPFQSDGGPALEDPRSPAIKIIETMGEYDLFSHASLYREQDDRLTYPHRREDSHSYRLYEVPGLPARNATYITRAEITNMAPGAYKAGEWSSFCSSYIYHAIFEAMDKWITTNVAPVPGAVMATTERGDFIQDMHGNTIGGIRTVHSEAPTSKLVDVKMNSRRTWFSGSERPFNKAKMKANYRNIANYRKLATEAIQAQLRVGFLLEDDREILHRDTVENVVF